MIREIAAAALCCISIHAGATGPAVVVEPLPWPPDPRCDTCIVIQIDELTIALPTAEPLRVVTFGELPGVHLSGSSLNDGGGLVSIMRWDTSALIDASKEIGLVSHSSELTIGAVLKQLSQLDDLGATTALLRKLVSFDQAVRITYSNKGDLEVYGYWNGPNRISKAVVVLNGCDSVSCDSAYEIHGNWSQVGFMRLLEGLSRSPPP